MSESPGEGGVAARPGMQPADAREIRERAESIRRQLKTYASRGGTTASFMPRVKRARRLLRRGDYEGALRVLVGIEMSLSDRLSAKIV